MAEAAVAAGSAVDVVAVVLAAAGSAVDVVEVVLAAAGSAEDVVAVTLAVVLVAVVLVAATAAAHAERANSLAVVVQGADLTIGQTPVVAMLGLLAGTDLDRLQVRGLVTMQRAAVELRGDSVSREAVLERS